MARQVRRISELPEATELTGDELLEIVQDGENKRVRVDDLPGGGAVQSVQGRTGDVVITADDVGLGNVDNTSDADKPVSTAQQEALDGKVDKVAGMGLSSNDFTDPLRDKLIGLEGTHWRGTFLSLSALQSGVTDPQAGDYADVDVAGEDVQRYIWDATDSVWVAQSGAVAPITASQVKMLYESNPDTNAFTDADVAKLGGIEEGATANSTDAYLLNRANHTGTQGISTVAGLQEALDGKVNTAPGMGLSSNDYTAAEKSKLGDVQPWATAPTQDAAQTALGMSASGKAVATGTPAQGRTALGADDASNLILGTLPDERVSETLPANKAYRQGNILGTVSQSGGVPTGAIIQSGANANGRFARFADGTQICISYVEDTAAINVAYSGGFRSEPRTYQYPASFAANPYIYFFPTYADPTTGAWDAMYAGGSINTWNINWRAHVSGASMVCRGYLLAIGRWY